MTLLNTRTYQNIWYFQIGYHARYVETVNTCEINGFRCGAIRDLRFVGYRTLTLPAQQPRKAKISVKYCPIYLRGHFHVNDALRPL
jgi:hypothetical protein